MRPADSLGRALRAPKHLQKLNRPNQDQDNREHYNLSCEARHFPLLRGRRLVEFLDRNFQSPHHFHNRALPVEALIGFLDEFVVIVFRSHSARLWFVVPNARIHWI